MVGIALPRKRSDSAASGQCAVAMADERGCRDFPVINPATKLVAKYVFCTYGADELCFKAELIQMVGNVERCSARKQGGRSGRGPTR